jgi:hypothetical protein
MTGHGRDGYETVPPDTTEQSISNILSQKGETK